MTRKHDSARTTGADPKPDQNPNCQLWSMLPDLHHELDSRSRRAPRALGRRGGGSERGVGRGGASGELWRWRRNLGLPTYWLLDNRASGSASGRPRPGDSPGEGPLPRVPPAPRDPPGRRLARESRL
ncbi:hypothetical protein KC19_5G190900 [Ceratodon purpureus]|uniref:Uncharacterized protein n=1 Tax=Ceratodon purpureus TaxID=3225 RepID=A0A8T0I4C3_CERPU|nr:hypothetical protein KC19_5G190900 [Ceratodon purpureus]